MRLPSAGDRARRMIAALAMWPERPWFWVGTAALVAALAAMPSKIRSAAAPGSGEEPLFARSLDPWAEERPAGNRDLPYSRPNIRFCRFQQVRLEAIGPLTDRADLAVFQALAAEWNARCAQYAYQPADKRAVEAAVMDRRESLESEGRALLSAWRRMIRFGAAPAAVPASGSWHFAAGSVADFPSLPSLITSGIPGSPESEPVSWPLLRAPSLALSHQNVAVRVQRRLNDLGYVVSPVDGIWGTSSRAALRHFKDANGLLNDDVLDAETVARLFSTSAVEAHSGGPARSEDGSGFETPYPPPPGARMNPLNREDAEQIQRRLGALGYYLGSDNGNWGTASRNALRRFKTMNRLSDEEEWDAATEHTLEAAEPARSLDRAVNAKSKGRAVAVKVEPMNARSAAATAAKRPAQAAVAAKPGNRATASMVQDVPRPPVPIPDASMSGTREP
jgi:peptidoglycan hydrolase-like protein with peptidoglycan-binding domain